MAYYAFRVGPYARVIYLDGTMKIEDLEVAYTQPIEAYAAAVKGFSYDQIDNALAKGYINQEQYDATIAMKLLLMPRPEVVADAAAVDPVI